MARTTLLSLLLLRRPSTRPIFLSHPHLTPNHRFSSISSSQTTTTSSNSSDPTKPTSLSARMSFVFDQIDAIERDRSEKDDALQRIRAWRESKKTKTDEKNHGQGFSPSESNESGESEVREVKEREVVGLADRKVEVVHPWPEWIELMERLVQQNYFDHRRKDEGKMVEDLGFKMEEVGEDSLGFDFTRDWKTVQTACLNFGRDRFDILRSLSRQDIQVLVGYGCPSADKKVVFSAKLLRKHVHLDEGDVCSSCSLRSTCERAYLVTNKEDEARTIDVMRVLLTYGFDPVNGSVVNESLLKMKSLKTVVRKLLHEVVKLSAVPIDPNLPPPIIKKRPPKVKQPPPPPKKRVGRDDIEMKKGDWLCPKCDFMNFAKNTVCLQCDAKRPKRQLLPGEWECPQCNFLNYRRNMVCFQCEHNRPPDDFTENQLQDRQRGPKTRLEKVPSRGEVSNAWNFDFDDNESDGADVAAFEYADSHKLDEDFPSHIQSQGENFKVPDNEFYRPNRTPRENDGEYYDHGHKRSRKGFDDFDDEEEEDDVDSYELDTQNSHQLHKSSSIDFSEVEGDSESEDVDGFDGDNRIAPQRNKPSKIMHGKSTFSGSEVDEQDYDSDDELPVHPNWKSSHSGDSNRRTRGSGAGSVGLDEDYGIDSDTDDLADSDFGSRRTKGDKWVLSDRHSRRRQIDDSDDEPFSESGSEDRYSPRNRFGGRKEGPDKRGNNSRGRGNNGGFQRDDGFNRSSQGLRGNNRGFQRDDGFDRSSQGPRGNNRGFQRDDGFNRSSQGSRGNSRGFQKDDYGNSRGFQRDDLGGRSRRDNRESDSRNSRGPSRGGFGNRQRGGLNDSYNRSDNRRDFDDGRPMRQRINVR
ncbi:hypothetical protein RHSIM_Rhsim07G0183400 [Rhododendron simsii]|uniref:RanBP2-type domain-containing protein n=1 Tax=Rhododendron simsii TaxID=118357 RepID=A0A834GTL9_RHOSS|nr:hypothetical protein RHSIM_Rhsim07G0183400 [Rhododendron simsii]